MAIKTISLDLEAYDLLSSRKKPGQSFSEVVKEHFGGPKTARDFLEASPQFRLSPKTLDAIEEIVRARPRSIAKAPRL